jgi:hypothetical protein
MIKYTMGITLQIIVGETDTIFFAAVTVVSDVGTMVFVVLTMVFAALTMVFVVAPKVFVSLTVAFAILTMVCVVSPMVFVVLTTVSVTLTIIFVVLTPVFVFSIPVYVVETTVCGNKTLFSEAEPIFYVSETGFSITKKTAGGDRATTQPNHSTPYLPIFAPITSPLMMISTRRFFCRP